MVQVPKAKTIQASRISIAQLMQPEHANNLGNVHGGWIMKLVDEAGALVCMRHAQRRAVTVAIDSMVFRNPIKIGDLGHLDGRINLCGAHFHGSRGPGAGRKSLYRGKDSYKYRLSCICCPGQRWPTRLGPFLDSRNRCRKESNSKRQSSARQSGLPLKNETISYWFEETHFSSVSYRSRDRHPDLP